MELVSLVYTNPRIQLHHSRKLTRGKQNEKQKREIKLTLVFCSFDEREEQAKMYYWLQFMYDLRFRVYIYDGNGENLCPKLMSDLRFRVC